MNSTILNNGLSPFKLKKASRIKHIIWDWNGTLLDDAHVCASAVNRLKLTRGLPLESFEAYRNSISYPVIEYYKACGFDLSQEPYAALCDDFAQAYAAFADDALEGKGLTTGQKVRIHPDVVAVLQSGLDAGLSHAIVSASDETTLFRQVEEQGLSAYFVSVVGRSDNHGGTKDHLVKAWVEASGYHRDEILLVGDTEHDYEAAVAAGIRVALIADGHVSSPRLKRCRVPFFENRAVLWEQLFPMVTTGVFRTLRFDTPIGEMGISSDNLGLVQVDLPEADPWQAPLGSRIQEADEALVSAKDGLLHWFQHPDQPIDYPLSILGTPFQREVWQATAQIAPGKTTSYKGLALHIGRPNAYRAVAMALKSNPVPIFIPCHRIIGSDGTPTGYMGKRNHPLQEVLLQLERDAVRQ